MPRTYKFALFLLSGALAFAQTSKLAPELQNADPKSNVQIIVQFDKDPTDTYHQKVLGKGGSLRAALHSVKGGAYSLPASALAELSKDPSVVHISQDHKLSAKLDYTAAAINAPQAWQSGWTGSGVGIALIDSGMSPDQDITQRNVGYQQNFVANEGTSTADAYGHGMHIAGILASNGTSSSCGNCTRTLKGMAPNATLVNLRVLDQNGESIDSTVISAIETAIQLKEKYNIQVMNLSLGRPVFESYKLDPLCQAVEAAWQAGIVVVVAAGNDGRDNSAGNQGYGTITSPGNDPYVITVGAMKTMGTYDRSDDLIASYSSKGPTLIDNVVKPDIVAPGNRVVSLLAPGAPTLQKEAGAQGQVLYSYYESGAVSGVSDRYLMLSGTSMATGVVSGAVADLLQAHPSLTPDQVKTLLMKTAYKVFPRSSVATDPQTGISYTSYYDVFTRGAGYLDLAAALLCKDPPAPGTALSPRASLDSATDSVYLVFSPNSVWSLASTSATLSAWGGNLPWTAVTTWGSSAVNANRSLWSESAAWASSSSWSDGSWGTSLLNAERSLWGTSVSTAERSLWGESSIPQSDGNSVVVVGEQ